MKKILFVFALLIVAAVIGFLAIGFFTPSIELKSSVVINKPRTEVWGYFNDVSKLKDWLDGFKSIETISGNPNEVGSRYRMTFVEDNAEIVFTETVTDYRATEIFGFVIENEMIKNNVAVTFSDKDGGTEVVQNELLVGGNIFWRSVFVLIKGSIGGKSQEALNKLKTNIEAGPR